MSSFGHKGPYSNQAGYDVIAQAYSGFMHMTGERDGSPMKTGYLIGDCVGALSGFGCIIAMLSASLWEKFCNAASHPEWKNAPDYCNVDARVDNQDKLIPLTNQ